MPLELSPHYANSLKRFSRSYQSPGRMAGIAVTVAVLNNSRSLQRNFTLCIPVAIVRNTARLQLFPRISRQPSQSFDTLEYTIDMGKMRLPSGDYLIRKYYSHSKNKKVPSLFEICSVFVQIFSKKNSPQIMPSAVAKRYIAALFFS